MAEVHPPAAAMISSLWNGTVAETVEPMLDVFERTGEAAEAVFQMLARAGRLDDLRRLLPSTRAPSRRGAVVPGDRLVHGGGGRRRGGRRRPGS